jgi:hypothetical protein
LYLPLKGTQYFGENFFMDLFPFSLFLMHSAVTNRWPLAILIGMVGHSSIILKSGRTFKLNKSINSFDPYQRWRQFPQDAVFTTTEFFVVENLLFRKKLR